VCHGLESGPVIIGLMMLQTIEIDSFSLPVERCNRIHLLSASIYSARVKGYDTRDGKRDRNVFYFFTSLVKRVVEFKISCYLSNRNFAVEMLLGTYAYNLF